MQDCPHNTLAWCPELESFQAVLREYGADLDHSGQDTKACQSKMWSPRNLQLVVQVVIWLVIVG